MVLTPVCTCYHVDKLLMTHFRFTTPAIGGPTASLPAQYAYLNHSGF